MKGNEMQQPEWEKLVKLLTDLWEKWNFNNAEIEVWRGKLIRYDKRAVASAIKNFYASEQNTRNKPKLGNIVVIAADINRNFHQPEEQETPHPDYILECTEAGMFFREGCQFPAHLLDRNKFDQLAELAEYDRRKHEKLYGGKWRVIRLWEQPDEPPGNEEYITAERKWEILDEKIKNTQNLAVKQMFQRMQKATEQNVVKAATGTAVNTIPEDKDTSSEQRAKTLKELDDVGF